MCIRQSSYTPKRTSAEARRCAIIGPAFGSVSALAAGLGTGGPPPCPRPIRSPGPLQHNVARSCSLLNGSCRCQLVSTLSPCKGCVCVRVCTRGGREGRSRERQARLRRHCLSVEGCWVGSIQAAVLTISPCSRVRCCYSLRLPQLTKEQATHTTIVCPPSRVPRGTFDRRECLAHSANSQSQLSIDRSLSKEPRGEAINILCVLSPAPCSMLP